jgi:hypothetical protein
MRYYIYISETKIDMLFSQIIKSEDERREASLGFDLTVLKGELKESRGIPANKFKKLDTTIGALTKKGVIGSLEENKPYISGKLRMTWASFGFRSNSPITYWGYFSRKLVLGLAGSKHHLLGEQAGGSAHSHSLTGPIVNWILREFGDTPPEDEDIEEAQRHYYDFSDSIDHSDISNAIWLAGSQIKGQRSDFDFVAKVLHRGKHRSYGDTNEWEVILATPLYVAMEE